jgi:hypothetical protein
MLALAHRRSGACPQQETSLPAAGLAPARIGAWRSRCDGSRMITATLFQAGMVAQAVEETITTPTPGMGHGRLGDIAAALTWVAGSLGLV